MTDSASTVRVVVLGAGFGGLELCKRLRHENVEITLVDRQNHHLFQPLLYQIATSGLSVLLQWVWAYLHYKPGARIILKTETRHEGECPPSSGA